MTIIIYHIKYPNLKYIKKNDYIEKSKLIDLL